MGKALKSLSYAHLHAYADQELVDPRRVDVADFVKTHPNLIIHIRDYELINTQLHRKKTQNKTQQAGKYPINHIDRYDSWGRHWGIFASVTATGVHY